MTNYSYSIVTSGQDAIEYLNKNSVDVIILYAEMNEISGLDVARHVRTVLNLPTPLIAITAHCFNEFKQEIVDSGFNYTLVKPFLANELFDILNLIEKELL